MRTRWDLMPRRVKRPGMLAGGDGSTLSLDFTAMSSLDSRFTFSRSSPATFINSSGLVKYADHNLFLNTVWTSTTAPTGWLQVALGGGQDGTFTYNGDGSISFSTGSSQRCLFQPSPAITVANGLTYTIGFEVVSVSGGTTISECLTNNLVTDSFYRNGVSVAGSTAVQAGDILQTVITTNATSITPRIGLGMGGAVSNKTIRIKTPQMNIGNTAATTLGYIANTSTTAAYHAPRFDYDPTTLAPRGLLIEGSATNELLRSNAFNTSPWFVSSFTTPSIASPAVTDPAGGTDTWYGVPSGAGLVYHGFRYTFTFTAATYTFSIWAKAAQHDKFIISDLTTGTGACRFDLTAKTATVITGTVTPTNPQIVQYPNGWFRCSFTMQMSAITTGMCWSSYPTGATTTQYGAQFTATGTDGMYFYGAQLELGSGASSYIPTGSSTVQRAADSCSMTGTNFSSWFNTIGTFVVEQELSGPFITSDRVGIGLGTYSSGTSSFGFFRNNTTTVGTAIWGSGGTGYQEGTISVAARSPARSGFTLDWSGATRSNRSFANGTVAASLVSTTGSITVDRMFIGANSATGTSASRDWINGHIRSIKFWPTVLPNATLQSLTQ